MKKIIPFTHIHKRSNISDISKMVNIHPFTNVILAPKHNRIPVQPIEADPPGRVQQSVPDGQPILHRTAPASPLLAAPVRAHLFLERVQPQDQTEEGVYCVRDAPVLDETDFAEVLVVTSWTAVASAVEYLVGETITECLIFLRFYISDFKTVLFII